MGLDQYAYAVTRAPLQAVDFPEPDQETMEMLHEWRKHPNLQGWMQALYLRKGGQNEEFNLSPVVLDSSDLERLERDLVFDRLPVTSGFFFGGSDGTEREDDFTFIEKARAAIAVGKTVLYIAWW
jgi:hypothetical protein